MINRKKVAIDNMFLCGLSGLNCAEAVNFAPADWLPHGGFGSELYKRYHKSAIISHEELLCVVAKVQILLSFTYSFWVATFFFPFCLLGEC